MRKLISFTGISLDGYYKRTSGEFDFPHVDEEFFDFSNRQDAYLDALVFGRETYEHMAAHWPNATEGDPEIIDFMNGVPKLAVSDTLERADWNNTTLVRRDDIAGTIKDLKQQPGKEIALFGSVQLTASLLELGLVDELRVIVFPVLLGEGVSAFSTLSGQVQLELWRTTTFRSGNVLLVYRPA
ncbi:dihydrofolate reductase family protein [Saccharopolyspora oryzae]|uniref:Dihydrofolate reductase family protein n=1 Tax=Saccharopolyspora oryzae TaxID=2997343 RepID=A0ABT4UXR2_9PSEU|nr:dihydrofolate reductase family protein [Saccharopolyspora oryzae]MDA3626496.1 dihydrofolate reductase family protein [Saccharopolyspora oryzae]